MSVQSEISRISGNVAAALAAIAEKGVSVPSGSKSDALASLIAAIEAGGGGAGGCITGTFTPSTYTDVVEIGSSIPDDNFFFAVMITVKTTKNSNSYILCGYFTCINGTISGVNVGANKSISSGEIPSDVIVTIDRNSQTIKFAPKFSSATTYFEDGSTFCWFLGGLA